MCWIIRPQKSFGLVTPCFLWYSAGGSWVALTGWWEPWRRLLGISIKRASRSSNCFHSPIHHYLSNNFLCLKPLMIRCGSISHIYNQRRFWKWRKEFLPCWASRWFFPWSLSFRSPRKVAEVKRESRVRWYLLKIFSIRSKGMECQEILHLFRRLIRLNLMKPRIDGQIHTADVFSAEK